jgi:hypothetical protein
MIRTALTHVRAVELGERAPEDAPGVEGTQPGHHDDRCRCDHPPVQGTPSSKMGPITAARSLGRSTASPNLGDTEPLTTASKTKRLGAQYLANLPCYPPKNLEGALSEVRSSSKTSKKRAAVQENRSDP